MESLSIWSLAGVVLSSYLLTSIVLMFMDNVLRRAATRKFIISGDFWRQILSSERICRYNFSTPTGNTQLTRGRLGATSSLCARGSD